MSYVLGVDLGTTYTSAAVADGDRVEVVQLGVRSSVVPTVVFLTESGELLVGEAANRRGSAAPARVAREFKRRLGDPAPLLLGGTPMAPQALMGAMLRWVLDRVGTERGEAPSGVALSHPANWGPYKLDLLGQAVREADLDSVTLISEPVAVARYFASGQRLAPGEIVAVYDLGGGTFDAAVVQATDDGFEVLGTPEGVEHLGGIDVDEAVFGFVGRDLGGALEELDVNDPAVTAGAARLRRDCVDAKEALSSDTEATVPVLLPALQTEVQITRGELEAMVRPSLASTITALERAIRSAQVTPDRLTAVLLAGGTSRMPLVAEMVGAALGRPVAVDTHPKHAVCLGAALAAQAAQAAAGDGVAARTPEIISPPTTPPRALAEPPPEMPRSDVPPSGDRPAGRQGRETLATGTPPPPPVPTAPVAPAAPASSSVGETTAKRDRRRAISIGAALVAIIAVASILIATRRGDGGERGGDGDAGAAGAAGAGTTEPLTTQPAAGDPYGIPAEAVALETPVDARAEITDIEMAGARYVPSIATENFTPDIEGDLHVHLFWDSTPVSQAGAPFPGPWLMWDEPARVDDEFFDTANRPADAGAICVVVVNAAHQIADVDGDRAPDTDTGGCSPLPEQGPSGTDSASTSRA